MKNLLIFITIVLLGVAAIWFASTKLPVVSQEMMEENDDAVQFTNASADLIVVDQPRAGDRVTSPLVVSGMARGYWFFEASFPIELVDDEGKILVNTYATTEESWMTEEMISFSSTLQFDAPDTNINGTLILRKDNPSGLLENDASIAIPVVIKGKY